MPKKPFILILSGFFCLNIFCRPLFAEEAVYTWMDCVREAAKKHPDLIAAAEVIKQNVAEKKITASVLFPQVDGSLTAATARSDSGSGGTIKDAYNYGLSGSQLIFDGAKTLNNIRADDQNISASRQAFKFTSATVRFDLRDAFISLLTAQERLNIAHQIYDIRRSNLEIITLRYESGLTHRGALMTAEANLAEARFDIKQAQREIEAAQGQLSKELGRDQVIPMRVLGDFEVMDSAKPKPDFYDLSLNNPSLLQAIALKNSAEFSLRSTYANFSPVLTGSAGANKNGTRWTPKGNQWNLGLSLSLPIFEGGLRFAQVQQAKAVVDQLAANEKSTRDSLVYTLEQTWADLQDAVDNVEVQKLNLEATQERSTIAQAQFAVGFISFDNWTIIEDNLVSAKKSLLNARSAALLAEASWIQAKGETLEYE